MKKRGRLRKGLAMLLSLAMVVGLMPGAGTMKVSAEESEASGSPAIAEGYDANGFCTSYELTNGAWALKSDVTACATHGETCNGYQPANKTTGTYEVDGNNDTQDEVYEISNAGQLYWFADKANNDSANYGNANAVLTANITVNSDLLKSLTFDNGEVTNGNRFRSWTPIGNNSNNYTGTFDGNNKTISGLYFNEIRTDDIGLFGYVGSGGSISNVTVIDSYFNGRNDVGGVCGKNQGTIKNCDNTGKVSSKRSKVGGVCGYNYAKSGTATIKNCNNAGEVSANSSVGGVCGCNEVENGTATIENCDNTGKVSGTSSNVGGVCGLNNGTIKNCNSKAEVSGKHQFTGGVCGYNYAESGTGTITNCYNKGRVNGALTVGGVCGLNEEGSIKKCYNTGAVISTNHEVGGVCGQNNAYNKPATITNCYNTGEVSKIDDGTEGGLYYVGGVCGKNFACYGSATIENCYNTGVVSGSSNTTNGNVGGVCGLNFVSSFGTGTTTSENCYYLSGTSTGGINGSDVTASAEVKSTEKFASGEVCYLLNNQSFEDPVWYQNIDLDGETADEYPVLDNSHGKVYQCATCTAVYSNTQGKEVAHSYKEDASGNTHTCEKCGDTKVHSTSPYLYIADAENHSVTAHCADYCGKTYGTVTIIAPDSNHLTYNGSAKTATLSGAVTGVTISDSDITYNQDETTLASAPINAGTYTASITLGTGTGATTASVEFVIEKATPDIGTVSAGVLSDTLDVKDMVLSRTKTDVSGIFSLKDTASLKYGTNDYTYVFTPTGNDAVNYKPVEGTVSITVNDTVCPDATVKIKDTAWKNLLNADTLGNFFKSTKDIDVEASDSTSGVDTISYYVSESLLTENEVKAISESGWKSYDSSNKPSLAKGTYYVYVKVKDKAGNTTYVGTDGIVIYEDSTPATAKFEYIYKENNDKQVAVTLNGNTVADIRDNVKTLTKDTDYSVADDGTITIKKSYLDGLAASNTPYELTVSYNPQGKTYSENRGGTSGNDLNDAPGKTVISITVTKASLTVTRATATDRTYNATDKVAITAVELSGVKDMDNVSVDIKDLTGTLSGKNVGQYLSVTLPILTLTGADAGNYTLVQPTRAVSTDVTISVADAEIIVDKTNYEKTFGDEAFDLGVTDNNTDEGADVSYEVSDGKNAASESVADDKVITVDKAGKVTIVGAGTATITASLDASNNFKEAESKTITVTVNKAPSAPGLPSGTMDVAYTIKTVSDVKLPVNWSWVEADKVKGLTVGTTVKATAVYNGADKGNYVAESVEVSITRQACTHTWDAGVVTKEATPTEKGEKTYTCTVCKETKTEEIPALGALAAGTTDTSDDGTATYKVTTSDLTKGTVAYVAPTNKNATTVSVPVTVTIDGVTYRVTSIADNAFANNKKLTKVTIGSNITTIGKKAFYKCTKLKTVKIGGKVTTISEKAFYKCTSLTKITIPSKVKKIGQEAFFGCKNLKSITIQTTKLTSKNVGSKAFRGIYAKATIKVPKSKLTSYKKILKAKGVSSKAKIKK